jgi:hypothetical protein
MGEKRKKKRFFTERNKLIIEGKEEKEIKNNRKIKQKKY